VQIDRNFSLEQEQCLWLVTLMARCFLHYSLFDALKLPLVARIGHDVDCAFSVAYDPYCYCFCSYKSGLCYFYGLDWAMLFNGCFYGHDYVVPLVFGL
jgi:hypothetical protein